MRDFGLIVEHEESTVTTNKEIIAGAYASFAHVWTLADGKVTRFQQHLDTAKGRSLIT